MWIGNLGGCLSIGIEIMNLLLLKESRDKCLDKVWIQILAQMLLKLLDLAALYLILDICIKQCTKEKPTVSLPHAFVLPREISKILITRQMSKFLFQIFWV